MQLDVSPSWYPLVFCETQYYFHANGHHLLAFHETQFRYHATGCPHQLGILWLFVKLCTIFMHLDVTMCWHPLAFVKLSTIFMHLDVTMCWHPLVLVKLSTIFIHLVVTMCWHP